jgi:hypothetical protein
VSTQLLRQGTDQAPPASPRPLDAVNEPTTVRPDNAAQINEIVDRLSSRYTAEQNSTADLRSRVRGIHQQFDAVRLRSFVAILVEGLVRRSIAARVQNPETF